MVTSNTYEFGVHTQIDDFIRESFERIGIIGNELTGLQAQSAIMSANLELTSWMGKVPLSWTRKRLMFSLFEGQPIYTMPVNITRVLDVVATTPQRLNTNGTPYSTQGGVAANCFDPAQTAGCTQTAPNGAIGFNYGGSPVSVLYVGITPLSQTQYTLAVDYSFDNVNFTTIYKAPTQTYFANQTTWFVIENALNANIWQIRETNGQTLAIQQIYFSQPTNIGSGDRYLTSLSYTEWMQISTKMNTSYPSSFFFNAQIQPTITLWPVPNNTYTNLLYTAYQYVQDVNALFNQFDVPQRFLDALVAGVAYRLSSKFATPRMGDLKAQAQESFELATKTDFEDVVLRFQPDFTAYKG